MYLEDISTNVGFPVININCRLNPKYNDVSMGEYGIERYCRKRKLRPFVNRGGILTSEGFIVPGSRNELEVIDVFFGLGEGKIFDFSDIGRCTHSYEGDSYEDFFEFYDTELIRIIDFSQLTIDQIKFVNPDYPEEEPYRAILTNGRYSAPRFRLGYLYGMGLREALPEIPELGVKLGILIDYFRRYHMDSSRNMSGSLEAKVRELEDRYVSWVKKPQSSSILTHKKKDSQLGVLNFDGPPGEIPF